MMPLFEFGSGVPTNFVRLKFDISVWVKLFNRNVKSFMHQKIIHSIVANKKEHL